MASRTSSALATLALAALSTAAVLTLGRVFASGRFVLPAVGAVLLAHLLGFVARTRGWSLIDALSLSMSGLAVYLIWFQAPHTTLYGIPTVDTFRVLADRLGDGVYELRTAVVPAPATSGAIVLSVLVVWVMAATADALAFWNRATIGAVAPRSHCSCGRRRSGPTRWQPRPPPASSSRRCCSSWCSSSRSSDAAGRRSPAGACEPARRS